MRWVYVVLSWIIVAANANPVDIRNGVEGNLQINNFNSGQNASSSTVWSGAGTWQSLAGVGFNDKSAVSGNPATFWPSSGPATVELMNRLMVGVAASGNLSPPGNTWLDALIGNTSVLANITTLGTIFSGINAASRTSDTVASGIGAPSAGSAGGYFFGYNDDTTTGNIALGLNSVGIAKVGNKGTTLGIQNDIDSAAASCVPTPSTPLCTVGTPATIGTLITAGAFSSLGTQNPTEALTIGPGTAGTTFNAGILFEANSITSGVGPSGGTVAVAMPAGYSIIWYSGTSGVAAINGDSSGNINIVTTGGGCLKVNGTCVTVP